MCGPDPKLYFPLSYLTVFFFFFYPCQTALLKTASLWMERLSQILWVCVRSVDVTVEGLTATKRSALILAATLPCLGRAVKTTVMVREGSATFRRASKVNKQRFDKHSMLFYLLGCSYAGKEYPNGNEFPHPTDACRTCSCIVRINIFIRLCLQSVVDPAFIYICVLFVKEWKRPMSKEEVSTAAMLQPESDTWRLLPPVSRYGTETAIMKNLVKTEK